MPFQKKTLFLWKTEVVKAAKTKLCATKHGIGVQGCFGTYKALTSQKPQAKAPDRRYQRQKRIPRRKPANSPRIRLRRILKFCAFAKKNAVSLTNQGCKGCQNEALCRKSKALCQKKPANYRKKRSFLQFCAFAKKNAVSLTNQGCKGCQNEALCRKSKALCQKKPA